MKKLLVLIAVVALCFSCARPARDRTQPLASDLPANFSFVSDEGNGYFRYKSPDGFFLVSIQKQGQPNVINPTSFVDIVYIGK